MSASTFLKNLDKDFLVEGRRKSGPDGEKVGLIPYFAWKAEEEGIEASKAQSDHWENYWLRKCMIDEKDPNDLRRADSVKSFAHDYAVVELLMKEAGLVTRGPMASTVERCIGKDLATTSQQTIFPIYYQSQIQAGLLTMPLLNRLLADMVTVNSDTAKHAELSDIGWQRGATTPVGQGARPNTVNIQAVERTIYLQKFMYIAAITYEAMRRQRLPLFATQLQRVGQQLQILLTNYVLDVIISGDGDNTSATTKANSTSAYADIIAAELDFPQAYHPNMLIVPAEGLAKILNMSEFKDPLAGFRYQANGVYPTPVGLELVRWDAITGEKPSAWATTTMLMLDTSRAVLGYQEGGGLMVETERVIDAQFEQVVTSMVFGAAVWDRQAARLMTGWS